MSVKNSNILGVYIDSDSTATSAISNTYSSDATTLAELTTDMAADLTQSSDEGNYIFRQFVSGSTTEYTGKYAFVNWNGSAATEISLDLVGCATNTSLDISNSINEAVCRDGLGGSTRHVVSGATSWSVSVDGLFGDETADSTAVDVVDLANNKSYVIVKFATDVTDSAGASTTYIGQALVESANLAGSVDDTATYNVSLSGQGSLYKMLTFA